MWIFVDMSIALLCVHKKRYNAVQKSGISMIFLLKKWILLFNTRRIKLIKSDSKDIYNVTKDFHFK